MKRKKIVGLLTVIIAVVFAFTAHGQEDCTQKEDYNIGSIETTTDCNNLTVGQVPCARTILRKQSEPIAEPVYAFDFDGQPYIGGRFGSYGYCEKYNSLATPWDGLTVPKTSDETLLINDNLSRDGKLIFDVCLCPEACIVDVGTRMGVQMIIETAGVYFAGPVPTSPTEPAPGNYAAGEPTIHFDISDGGSFCANKKEMGEATVFYNTEDNRVATRANSVRESKEVRNFGPIKYYSSYQDTECNSKGYFITKGVSEIKPPFSEGPFGANQGVKARVLQSSITTDYVFTEWDITANRNCYVWVDVPPMRVDPDVAEPGAEIKLKVRFLFHKEEVICEDCAPPVVCEMTRVVGRVCCDVSPTDNCMFFPYAVQNFGAWDTGVAITARSALPSNAKCTLTLIDAAGNEATYVKSNPGRIWTFMLNNEVSKFSGGTIAEGPVSLEVNSNYPMHGYSFLVENETLSFGAGTLPVGCTPGECSP